jgi:hypothetical protein
MNRVCAWCGRRLNQSAHLKTLQVTHGLCVDCRQRFFAPAKTKEAVPPPPPKNPLTISENRRKKDD